ncbi:Pseudouridine synthase and archaeosine transglycosylase (PUA) domain-containing protein [Balamuthia mandrillaris]
MFKKFTADENVTGQNQVKASVGRGIRNSILEQYPILEPIMDEVMPKKAPTIVVKCQNHVNLIMVNHFILFFNIRDGPYYPTLRLLHKYPDLLPKFQVDKGAIRFVLSGANIMCPGLTSPGGRMDDVPTDSIVAIFAEGKENPLAIGLTKMSTEEIRTTNKGIGVDNIHYLNDGLWNLKLE